MLQYLKSYRRLAYDRRAVTAVEYGLIVALVGVVISGALLSLGNSMSAILTKLGITLAST